jgi:chitinase
MRFSNMLLSGAATLLSLSTLSQAIPLPEDGAMSAAATGYKNVAYFVNWVRLLGTTPPIAY